MTWLRRPVMIVLAGLMAVLLLLAEYWLLINQTGRQDSERYALWGTYSLNLVGQRLQTSLEYASALAQRGSEPVDRAGFLPTLAGVALQASGPFSGIALVREVPAGQRDAFQAETDRPISVLDNHHLIPSPPRTHYFPVTGYLPDDADSLLAGLDIAATPGWERALEQARNSGRPTLAAYREQDIGASRLYLIAPVARQSQRFLLFGIDRTRLLNLQLPGGDNAIRHLRLIAWGKISNAQPFLLLDTQPDQDSPSTAPVASQTLTLGAMEVMFGAYRTTPVTTAPQEGHLHIMALSTVGLLLALALLYAFDYRNGQLRSRLDTLTGQLARVNDTLRQQIGERIHADQGRTESEMRQRAILDASSDPILLIDHDGVLSNINPAAARLIGQTAESLDGLAIGALFPELYDSQHQLRFEALASRFEGLPFETVLVRGDESKLSVELSLSRVVLPDDQFFLLVCRDITVRKEQEAALIRLKNSLAEQVEVQSRQLAALLDASPLAMAYIVERKVKQVNHAFLDMFEADEARVINQTTRDSYLSEEQYERTGRLLYLRLNEGEVVTSEQQLQTGRGRRIWCRLYGKALNPAVPGLGSIWVFQDFSSERAAEEALRTAKEMAEESSRTKTEFLANMSHELRTPMHAILGFAEMGQSRSSEPEQGKIRQYFERILASGNRLLSLLNDLLDLAKMEVGRMEYTMAEQDLVQQLREICDEMGCLAEGHDIRIVLDCRPSSLPATFDGLRIGQVLRNLLSNAIKFSPDSGEIRVEATLVANTAYPLARVRVIDQGPGIPAGELESIFDKFIQSSSTKTGAGGTGLGLAICREIVHAHQGEIRAENTPQGGAVFSFTLPVQSRIPMTEETDHAA